MNKRGFELAISTLVIIVLALLVLLALSLAFSSGFKNFWNTIKGYFGSEIDSLRNVCKNQCVLENKFSYCCEERKLDNREITCQDDILDVKCDIDCGGVC